MAESLTLRISGGHMRGRKLTLPTLPGLRPTPSRVRETLFNWLQGWIEGQRVLDMFAGAGGLSLEALSRGAASVHAIENNQQLCQSLIKTAGDWGVDGLHVHRGDALSLAIDSRFDLIFIDPPFGKNLLQPALARAAECLAEGGMVVIEHEKGVEIPAGWVELKRTKAGQEHLALLERA